MDSAAVRQRKKAEAPAGARPARGGDRASRWKPLAGSFWPLCFRVTKLSLVALVLVAVALAGWILYVNGGLGGHHMLDLTTQPTLQASALEEVAQLPSLPGNVAVSADGRVFFTFHPEGGFHVMLAEWLTSSKTWVPYPSLEAQAQFSTPLSVRIHGNRLYVLDFAQFGLFRPRLFGFDIARGGEQVLEYAFPSSVAGLGSMLNDFAVSPDGRYLYIAETSMFRGNPGLVVFDVQQQQAWRALSSHASMFAERLRMVIDGQPCTAFGVFEMRPHVDSIALDRKGEYLYYAPVAHHSLFRVHSRYLLPEVSDAERAAHVEVFANKSMSDGISTDDQGNVYLTDMEHSAINVVDSKGKLTTLIQDPRLRWPDGVGFGPDGYLYLTCSALQYKFRGDPLAKNAPYHIYRVRTGHTAAAGQ